MPLRFITVYLVVLNGLFCAAKTPPPVVEHEILDLADRASSDGLSQVVKRLESA